MGLKLPLTLKNCLLRASSLSACSLFKLPHAKREDLCRCVWGGRGRSQDSIGVGYQMSIIKGNVKFLSSFPFVFVFYSVGGRGLQNLHFVLYAGPVLALFKSPDHSVHELILQLCRGPTRA